MVFVMCNNPSCSCSHVVNSCVCFCHVHFLLETLLKNVLYSFIGLSIELELEDIFLYMCTSTSVFVDELF